MTHAPGPWMVSEHRGVWAGPVVKAGQTGVAFIVGEHEANARLIAAAPELLAVCKRVARDLSMVLWKDGCGYTLCGSPARTEQLLRDAIAKAEGRTHEE